MAIRGVVAKPHSSAPRGHARNGNVATSLDLTVSLRGHATTQVIEHKRLMRLSETKLPRRTSILDASPSRSATFTITTGSEDMIRLHLSDAARDDTDSHFWDELDRYTSEGWSTSLNHR